MIGDAQIFYSRLTNAEGHVKKPPMNTFDRTLSDHGASPDDLVRFDNDNADLLPYATLSAARHSGDEDLAALVAVYEWQGSPLAFLVDATTLRDDKHLQSIRRRLALRGDAPYLAVVGAGRLTLHRIALDATKATKTLLSLTDLPEKPATFAYLANNRPGLEVRRRWIADVVLTLLGKAIDALIKEAGVANDDAISLVGRALFARFLLDRKLLPPQLLAGQPAHCLFDNATNAMATCRWLDETFNGDLLPFSHGLFSRLPQAAFVRLGDIMHGTPDSQRYLDWKEDWAHLDFAHIPVGVLSQAYEHHQRRHTQERQRREGGYYTPRPLAELLVRGAFHALRAEGRAHDARALDPAAGAGVFLLTTFRQLVAERWRKDGKRPDTRTLRDILYDQITGFDINEAGLRFAALGLYLLSIELDPHPEPVRKLAFKKDLRGHVLFKVGEEGSLGSLGPAVGDEHNGRYDLVIGNPPWASATGLADWSLVTERVKRIATARLPADGPEPRLPNEVLDLPFVWRAMEWARPGGQIAFALHGRLLFQQGNGMDIARAALFRTVDVTGVVNGADLCQTPVWPQIGVPFCLLYARNKLPPPGAGFRYVSPRLEKGLNDNGQLRLDADRSDLLSPQQVAERPEILKLLYRGGPLGLEVFDRLTARGIGTLIDFVNRSGLIHSNGYQKLRKSTKKPIACGHLSMLPELPVGMPLPLLVDLSTLPPFDQSALHRIRNKALFRGPLLIIHESPPSQSGRIDVTVSNGDVVFNQSFHGYSAETHANGLQLVRYLALVVGSKPALWHALMTSGRLGFDRRIIEKFILDAIPVQPFEQLSTADRSRIDPLFDTIACGGGEAAWTEADNWVAKLYGLRTRDLEVIADTLRFELPFAAQRQAAQQPPSTAERKAFRTALEAELRPWAQRSNRPLKVDLVEAPNGSPWGLLRIDTSGGTQLTTENDWLEVLRLADRLAGSEVLQLENDKEVLWLARLSQARYWSRSAARIAARRIVWEHADKLFGSAAA